jgi:hypothetical protein
MTWPKVPLATSLGLKLFFVHMIGITIASSKIIGRRLVLSSCKQLKLWCSKTEKIEWRPLVMQTWNCSGGDSFCMANISAHEYTSDRKEEKYQRLECCNYEPYNNHTPLEVHVINTRFVHLGACFWSWGIDIMCIYARVWTSVDHWWFDKIEFNNNLNQKC